MFDAEKFVADHQGTDVYEVIELAYEQGRKDGHSEQLPSAQPNTGKWISADAMFGGVPFYCSECGENTRDTVMGKPRWKFCPMCGAKMEGVEDGFN